MCDAASDHVMEFIFKERKDKKHCVIYYVSRTLDEGWKDYTTMAMELVVVLYAIEKFRHIF